MSVKFFREQRINLELFERYELAQGDDIHNTMFAFVHKVGLASLSKLLFLHNLALYAEMSLDTSKKFGIRQRILLFASLSLLLSANFSLFSVNQPTLQMSMIIFALGCVCDAMPIFIIFELGIITSSYKLNN